MTYKTTTAISSAQLSSAQLSSAQLSSAQLSSAQLSAAQLSSAQLSSAQLSSLSPVKGVVCLGHLALLSSKALYNTAKNTLRTGLFHIQYQSRFPIAN